MPRLKSVCVYCGSSNRGPRRDQDAAHELGRRLAEAGIGLVFGGGRVVLIGRLADAAVTTAGKVNGLSPDQLVRAEVGHAFVTHLLVTKSMHECKEPIFRLADAFVGLP